MLINFLKSSFEFNKYNSRNNQGKIVTYRRKKFKFKKKFKFVDLKRFFSFTSIRVLKFLVDSKKSSFLALVYFCNFGLFSYILSAKNLKIGSLLSNLNSDSFLSSDTTIYKKNNFSSFFQQGNQYFLKFLPLGSKIFNINLHCFGNGQLVRAAGTFASLFRKIKLKNGLEFIGIQLASGMSIYISAHSVVGTLGVSSNEKLNMLIGLGARSLKITNRRPRVRGVAMNPVDHPHGGGEGKTSGGRISVSRWGLLAKGGKTVSLIKKYKRRNFLNKLKKNVSI